MDEVIWKPFMELVFLKEAMVMDSNTSLLFFHNPEKVC
ncbi:hypothetical protein NU09_2360 [Flavobacterium beibuense]|uniref:Uncharacterized protein n=1 Tax=Flavobacterium beibuense TaxID=657326 RepID=A0A444W9Q3_9FLAO|nr:hypothetical protein NU09_2360 [Flavobacterium beibuense]